MSFDHHLNQIAYGQLTPESVEVVAARLTEIEARLPPPIRDELTRLLDGQRATDVALQMRAALSPGHQRQEARRIHELAPEAEPSPAQIAEAAEYLLLEATNPLAASPDLRTRLMALDRLY